MLTRRCLDFVNSTYDNKAIACLTMQTSFAEKWQVLDSSADTEIKVLPYIEDALEYVKALDSATGDDKIDVLITGSVHLVGRALGALEGVDAL
jgi:folylpolyglutamate synthase